MQHVSVRSNRSLATQQLHKPHRISTKPYGKLLNCKLIAFRFVRVLKSTPAGKSDNDNIETRCVTAWCKWKMLRCNNVIKCPTLVYRKLAQNRKLSYKFLFSHLLEAYVFAQYFFYLLVYAIKVAGTVVHFVFAGLRAEEGYGAPAGGCDANNVR